jgi:hypothetical protein
MPPRAPMPMSELQDALRRLYLAPDQIGDIPEEILVLLRMLLHERDHASERIARYLRNTVSL